MPANVPILRVEVNPKIQAVVRALRRDRKTAFNRFLKDGAKTIHKLIIMEAPYRTGQLRKAWRTRQTGAGFEVFVDQRMRGAKYEPFVRLGTRPHLILPRKKKALYWPGLPHPVAYANHPGTKPNPYPERALQKAPAALKKHEKALQIEIEKELTSL